MNKINDKMIMANLEERYHLICKKYGENRILGIFISGIANYGFCEYEDELRYTAIFVPSFEDMCTLEPINMVFQGIRIIDIRNLYDISRQSEWNSLELLYSPYQRINQRFEKDYNKFFFNKRKMFAEYDPFARIRTAKIRAFEALNRNDHFEAMRLNMAAKLYLSNEDYSDCFYIKNKVYETYLWETKKGNQTVEAFELEESFNEFLLEARKKDKQENAMAELKSGVVEILRYSNFDIDLKQDMLGSLTKKELIALEEFCGLLKENVTIYNFSIKDVCKNSGVSRIVWNSLFEKLKRAEIIETKNKGKYGTDIILLMRPLDLTLLKNNLIIDKEEEE